MAYRSKGENGDKLLLRTFAFCGANPWYMNGSRMRRRRKYAIFSGQWPVSVVKDRERHYLLIALIVRLEGEIICKDWPSRRRRFAHGVCGIPGPQMRGTRAPGCPGGRSIFARIGLWSPWCPNARHQGHPALLTVHSPYPEGVAATVTGRATIADRTGSAGQT
jgi:hypothetical protein